MPSYTPTSLTALFLQTSLEDSLADFTRSLSSPSFPHRDAVILTASNESQADGYRRQIAYRADRLPRRTEFIVVPDEGGVRVGSAGSTLPAMTGTGLTRCLTCSWSRWRACRGG